MQEQDDIYTDIKQDEPVIPTAKEIRAVYNNKLEYIPPIVYELKIHYIKIDDRNSGIFDDKNMAYGVLNAINNTYASGIDPEHINEALQTLIALRNQFIFSKKNDRYTAHLNKQSFSFLSNVIDKVFIK